MRHCVGSQRDAAPDAYLAHQFCHVRFDRPNFNAEGYPNLLVRPAVHQHFQNLFFAQCESSPAAQEKISPDNGRTLNKNRQQLARNPHRASTYCTDGTDELHRRSTLLYITLSTTRKGGKNPLVVHPGTYCNDLRLRIKRLQLDYIPK